MSKRLKQYLVDALDGKNKILNKIANDHHYKEQLESMVEDFVFTEQPFEADLLKTATKLLQNSTNNKYVIVLLLYAIHLDLYHSKYSSWYKRDVLVDVLFCIIINHSRYCIKQKFCNYTFFLFICSIVFILFSY